MKNIDCITNSHKNTKMFRVINTHTAVIYTNLTEIHKISKTIFGESLRNDYFCIIH